MLFHSSLLLSLTAGCSVDTYQTTDYTLIPDTEENTTPNEIVEGESLVEDEDTGSYEVLDPEACPEGRYGRTSMEGGVSESHGVNRAKLEAAALYAEQNQSDCMVVVKDGAIIGEWYWNTILSHSIK